MPPILTITRDTREQCPVPFPSTFAWITPGDRQQIIRLKVEDRTLKTADYTNEARTVGIERKASSRELWECCCGSARRQRSFIDQLTRLRAEFKYPYLLVEQDFSRICRKHRDVAQPAKMCATIFSRAAEHGVHPIFVTGYGCRSRYHVGEMIALLIKSKEVHP